MRTTRTLTAWLVCLVAVVLLCAPRLAAPCMWGRVVCAACAAREWRVHYGGLVLYRTPLDWPEQAWWQTVAHRGHAHEWHRVGCWGFGLPWPPAVTCTMIREYDSFLGSLPRHRDQGLAREIALRLAEMDPDRRWKEQVASAHPATSAGK